MGKYPFNKDTCPKSLAVQYIIANELAECNRLKRVELSHKTWTNKNGVEFLLRESNSLEDEA